MVLEAPSLGFDLGHTGFTFTVGGGSLRGRPGVDDAHVVAELDEGALARLVQDVQSTMGLAMTSRVQLIAGHARRLDRLGADPARAVRRPPRLRDRRRSTFVDADGDPLDLDPASPSTTTATRSRTSSPRPASSTSRTSSTESEMAAVATDLDDWTRRGHARRRRVVVGDRRRRRRPTGAGAVVRREVGRTARAAPTTGYQWLADLTGDGHEPTSSAPRASSSRWTSCGAVRPAVAQGLRPGSCTPTSCSGMTGGISVTGADRRQRRARRHPRHHTGPTRCRRGATRARSSVADARDPDR